MFDGAGEFCQLRLNVSNVLAVGRQQYRCLGVCLHRYSKLVVFDCFHTSAPLRPSLSLISRLDVFTSCTQYTCTYAIRAKVCAYLDSNYLVQNKQIIHFYFSCIFSHSLKSLTEFLQIRFLKQTVSLFELHISHHHVPR